MSTRQLQLDTSGSEDDDQKRDRDSHSTSPDTSLDTSRVGELARTRSMSARGSCLIQIPESHPEEEDESQPQSGKRRGSLPDLKSEYKRRRKLPLGRILSPSHIDGFRKWALGDKFLDDLEMLKEKYEQKRHSSVPLSQVIQEAEDDEMEGLDVNRKFVTLQDKREPFSKRRSFTPEIQESIVEESEEWESKNIIKHGDFLRRMGCDVADMPESPRPRMSLVSSESILEEDESQESHQFKHDEFIKRISTYEIPHPTKESSVQLIEVCEEEEEK